jgi:hypothetical protein
MAKGEKRGNREAKKPKQEKPKATPTPSSFAAAAGKANSMARPGGAKR